MSLDAEFKFYKDHQDELVLKFKGRFLVIRDQTVVGDYDSELKAYLEAKKIYEVGTFRIQRCLPGDESTSQTFHSRVSFPPLSFRSTI